jgi:hypothetical protein
MVRLPGLPEKYSFEMKGTPCKCSTNRLAWACHEPSSLIAALGKGKASRVLPEVSATARTLMGTSMLTSQPLPASVLGSACL